MEYSASVVFWPYKHNGICFLSIAVSKRIRKKEKFPFSLFEMHGDRSILYSAFVVFWPHKQNGICFFLSKAVS